MNVEIIRVSGQVEQHNVPRGGSMDAIAVLIGAQTLDTVNLRDGRVMLVDDGGWETEMVDQGGGHLALKPIRARKPINPGATELYHSVCVPGTTHQIAGDAAIARDEDFA